MRSRAVRRPFLVLRFDGFGASALANLLFLILNFRKQVDDVAVVLLEIRGIVLHVRFNFRASQVGNLASSKEEAVYGISQRLRERGDAFSIFSAFFAPSAVKSPPQLVSIKTAR